MTAVWRYIETGDCLRCDLPDFLYTHSEYHHIAELFGDGFDWAVLCVSCHRVRGRELYSVDFEGREEVQESIVDYYPARGYPSPEIQADSPALCYVCERPETERYPLVEAVLASDCTIIVRTHKTCCRVQSNCCGRTFPTTGRWATVQRRAQIDDDLVRNFEIGDTPMCTACRNEYLKENEYSWDDFGQCNWCNAYYHEDDLRAFLDGRFCDRCYDRHTHECGDCGEEFLGDDHDCQSERDDDYDDGVIHDYSYKPSPYFFRTRTDKPDEQTYFGIELEVENTSGSRRENAEFVQTNLGHRVYIKSDGSLTHGFEIVTHPHTLEAYKRDFSWDTFVKFRRVGLRSWDTTTCGLHIHISRKTFGLGLDEYNNETFERHPEWERIISARQAHELRFIKLIYDNQRQICRLAGRTSDYASFADKGNLVRKIKDGFQSEGHYSAVNTENPSTIEVRVFRGSLIPSRILSAIELVHAATEYTRNLKVNGKNKALSWLAFTSYVHSNLETYENLHQYITQSLQQESVSE